MVVVPPVEQANKCSGTRMNSGKVWSSLMVEVFLTVDVLRLSTCEFRVCQHHSSDALGMTRKLLGATF